MMEDKQSIKVIIADDHLVIRSGIRAVLSVYDGVELAGEAVNGQEAVELCEKYRPHVVLMDIMMPVMDGIEATASIMERWPDTRIIMLSSYKDAELVEGSLKAGAISYLLKNASADEIVNAIREASGGRSMISPEVTQVMVSEMKKQKEKAYNLTRREKEILALMIDGLSNKEIAKKLVVSSYAIKFHVSNILNKLGVYSRSGAVSLALKQNLVK
jgi:NarL family two-component system response regulator LiaR